MFRRMIESKTGHRRFGESKILFSRFVKNRLARLINRLIVTREF